MHEVTITQTGQMDALIECLSRWQVQIGTTACLPQHRILLWQAKEVSWQMAEHAKLLINKILQLNWCTAILAPASLYIARTK